MIYFLALLPATMLIVAGYVVLFVSGRSEGSFRAFGKYLGFWVFTLAGLIILGAIFAAAHGGHHKMCHTAMGGPGDGCWAGHPCTGCPCAREAPGPSQPGESPPGAASSTAPTKPTTSPP